MWVRKRSTGTLDLRFLLRRRSLFKRRFICSDGVRIFKQERTSLSCGLHVDGQTDSILKRYSIQRVCVCVFKLNALLITHSGSSINFYIISLGFPTNSESNRMRTFITCRKHPNLNAVTLLNSFFMLLVNSPNIK